MTTDRPYNSTLTTKGALLSDTKIILQEVVGGRDVEEMRKAVLDEGLLDRGTRRNRGNVWGEVSAATLAGGTHTR